MSIHVDRGQHRGLVALAAESRGAGDLLVRGPWYGFNGVYGYLVVKSILAHVRRR